MGLFHDDVTHQPVALIAIPLLRICSGVMQRRACQSPVRCLSKAAVELNRSLQTEQAQ